MIRTNGTTVNGGGGPRGAARQQPAILNRIRLTRAHTAAFQRIVLPAFDLDGSNPNIQLLDQLLAIEQTALKAVAASPRDLKQLSNCRRKMLELLPNGAKGDYLDFLFSLGNAYVVLRDFEPAISIFQQMTLVPSEAKNHDVLNNLAIAQTCHAEQVFLSGNGGSPGVFYQRAIEHFEAAKKTNSTVEAEEAFEAAVYEARARVGLAIFSSSTIAYELIESIIDLSKQNYADPDRTLEMYRDGMRRILKLMLTRMSVAEIFSLFKASDYFQDHATDFITVLLAEKPEEYEAIISAFTEDVTLEALESLDDLSQELKACFKAAAKIADRSKFNKRIAGALLYYLVETILEEKGSAAQKETRPLLKAAKGKDKALYFRPHVAAAEAKAKKVLAQLRKEAKQVQAAEKQDLQVKATDEAFDKIDQLVKAGELEQAVLLADELWESDSRVHDYFVTLLQDEQLRGQVEKHLAVIYRRMEKATKGIIDDYKEAYQERGIFSAGFLKKLLTYNNPADSAALKGNVVKEYVAYKKFYDLFFVRLRDLDSLVDICIKITDSPLARPSCFDSVWLQYLASQADSLQNKIKQPAQRKKLEAIRLDLYKRAIALDAGNAQAKLALAIELSIAGKLEETDAVLADIQQEHEAPAIKLRAFAIYILNQGHKATRLMTKGKVREAKQLVRASRLAYERLKGEGILQQVIDNPASAGYGYEESHQLPSNVGYLHFTVGKYRKAENVYKEALAVNPFAARTIGAMTGALFLQGKLSETIIFLSDKLEAMDEKGITKSLDNVLAYAEALVQAGHEDVALTLLSSHMVISDFNLQLTWTRVQAVVARNTKDSALLDKALKSFAVAEKDLEGEISQRSLRERNQFLAYFKMVEAEVLKTQDRIMGNLGERKKIVKLYEEAIELFVQDPDTKYREIDARLALSDTFLFWSSENIKQAREKGEPADDISVEYFIQASEGMVEIVELFPSYTPARVEHLMFLGIDPAENGEEMLGHLRELLKKENVHGFSPKAISFLLILTISEIEAIQKQAIGMVKTLKKRLVSKEFDRRVQEAIDEHLSSKPERLDSLPAEVKQLLGI